MRNEVLENKKAVVAEIQEKVNNSASSIIVEYHGLNVGQITTLRRQLREEGIEFKVYKNKMFQRAVEGTEFESLASELVGPNAVAFGTDAVAPSRVLAQFAKKNKKLVLKAGIVDGNVVNAEEISELSALPNHQGMVAMLAGMLQSPIRKFAYAVSLVAEQRQANEGAPVVEETAPAVEEVAVEAEAPAAEVVEEAAPVAEETTEEVTEEKEA
ncbi:50S ribosomal protein L10 [Erysipelothrix sp. HDW6C]|uniref:50S ribosomal protein L10 n=1 Tax=Erysipelothrix sp. HDW6C TaxID=2714930 RepID=UPI00140AA7B7|nr:50S ribosomal protein L10 [Erysipelothrix sp. HDW6C]QIK70811.1 50S ribosomal protein L10 [Erysipelothrix sp. HDW6C]